MDLPVTTRPVRPDDAPLFCRLWDRLSPETVYRRFHAPLRRPPAEAHRLVEVDHDLREALVAVIGGEVVGVARYDRSPADPRSEEHTSELQSRQYLVCRLLLEKKKDKTR